jgi:TolB-like protein/tRNA A-37 threonylcarbamoyl transferase component Bud32/Tfp pilus assembly protein PilF
VADVLDHLKAALGDRYTIERELGRGGMATVYLARDLKHQRHVAIKVLDPELARALGAERFLREVEVTANLNHPHILPLHDSGEADGFLFYVMPYVEGETLRERMNREGQLPLDDALQITREVAAALSYAHSHDVIHRDIKPENVLLSAGEAVVADFGIARAITAAGGEHLTDTGISIGTPTYMSPEQASGEHQIDGRSDIYALGCVLYEMLVSEPPFTGPTAHAVIAKKLSEPTPRISVVRESVPPGVAAALTKALAKTPADRFGTASAFTEALTSELVVARVGRRRWPWLATSGATIVLLAAVALVLLNGLSGPAYERLAVLPPANLMNDPEQEYFVEGVHNALISELQRAGVTVIARTSVLQYENTQKPIREIAGELGVDALVEAAVVRAADSVEIEARVVDGTTEQYVADPIVRRSDLRNIERLYRGLTAAIAAEIHAALTPQAEARLTSAREVDPQAYDAYLKGQFYAGKMTPPDLEAALRYFELALEHDPEYARAYAGIALAWGIRSQFAYVRPRDAVPHMRAAAERAAELDSSLAEVQWALAGVRTWHLWDWAGAEVAFERAIEINPNYPDVRAGYSHFLLHMQRPDEALRQSQLAVALDPFNPLIQLFHGFVLGRLGRYDDAIAQFNTLLRTVPNHPGAHLGLQHVYHEKGMYDESLAEANMAYVLSDFTQAEEALASGYAEGGYRGAMRHLADTLATLWNVSYAHPTDIADLYLFAGEKSLALDWLERGLEERDPNMPYMCTFTNPDSDWESLRDDPRLRNICLRVGLPER